MDYESKYNQLVEAARAVVEGNPGLCDIFEELGRLRKLLPEKESEDERIRKMLVEQMERWKKCAEDNNVEQDVKDASAALAYLEKQKDKRELDFAEGKVEGAKQTCQEIKDAMSLFEPKDLTPFEFTFRDYIDSAIRYCLSGEGYQQYIKEWAADLLNLEKKKEQKPADDKAFEEWIDDWWKHNKVNNPDSYDKGDEIQFDERGFKNFCRGIRNMYAEQKPTEKQDLVAQLKEHLANTPKEQLEAEWKELEKWNHVGPTVEEYLRSIKPAEWSEEDEKMLVGIIERGSAQIPPHEPALRDDQMEWLMNRLRFLRPHPHWKPSEEQMRALRFAAYEFGNDILSPYSIKNKELACLYEQFKKL